MREAAGICWPHGGTVGLLTVTTPFIRGSFPAQQGSNATVCCDLVGAGKYRNGAARAWCRTHQQYRGTKADLADHAESGLMRCSRHADPMHYVLSPLVVDMRKHEQVRIALSGQQLTVQLDNLPATTHGALAIACDPAAAFFPAADICQVNVTPAAMAVSARECMCCARCGHPHLDLGEFAVRAHRRHYCGYCGNDSTHSKHAIVSNPLVALSQHYGCRLQFSGTIVPADTML